MGQPGPLAPIGRRFRSEMARSRVIRPSFFTSFSLARVSRDARLFFAGLWIEADDQGRVINSPKLLAASIFPHDSDVTVRKVNRWLDELAGIGVVERYEAGGGQYLHIPGFAEHQRVPHPSPSKLPPPPATGSRTFYENLMSDSGQVQEPRAKNSRDAHAYVSVSDYVPVSVSEPEAVENGSGCYATDNGTGTGTPGLEVAYRLAALCAGRNRERVNREALAVAAWACPHVDKRVIDESIGWFQVKGRPELPRAVAAVIRSKASDHNITLGEFCPP